MADNFFIALRRPQALRNCHITHIVSVLEWQFDADNPLTRGFQHLHIPVDDVEDENLLTWFPRSNAWIHDALTNWRPSKNDSQGANSANDTDSLDSEQGHGVLIHCAMGKSRSATILLAYLLWSSRQTSTSSSTLKDDDSMVSIPRKPLSVVDALMLLRQGRPIAEPNEGFMDQLHLFVDMGCPTTQHQLDNHKLYRRWMNKRNVEESLRINRAPDMVDIRFEDEPLDDEEEISSKTANLSVKAEDQEKIAPGITAPSGATLPTSEPPNDTETMVKCRRCRYLLARSSFIIPHVPSKGDPSSTTCAHVFLHPLGWMKETLSEGQLEGRLTCPNKKCSQNIGKFAWQGLRCSCGKWVTPGFGVARGKVDEFTVDNRAGPGGGGDLESAGGGAVRLPPGMRKQGKI